MLSESAGGALTTARNTETHFAARLYNIFNIVLLLHKLPGPLLTTAVNRHISTRLLGSPLPRYTAASPASPATSCPEGWTRCFFCLSTLSCVYTDSATFQGEQYPATLPGCFFLFSFACYPVSFSWWVQCTHRASFFPFHGIRCHCFSWCLADWTFSELQHASSSRATPGASLH